MSTRNEDYETAKVQGECAIRNLVAQFPMLVPILEENIKDNGEVLPHLVMSDIVRWMAEHAQTDRDVCRGVMEWMEEQMVDGKEAVQNMVAVSGVEMLPDPGEPGDVLRTFLGPELRNDDPWAQVAEERTVYLYRSPFDR